jgi:HlyD family secretion protein
MDSAKAAQDAAEAKLAVNQKALTLELVGPRREDIAQAEAQLRADQAQLALLQQQLKDADLAAPLDAVVRSRIVEPGDMSSPQKSAFTLAITDPKWVRAYVADTDLGSVREGMSATVSVDAFNAQRFQGHVGFISPVAEFTPKSVETTELRSSLVYEIRVFVTDPDDVLRLGMPATVHLPLQHASDARAGAGGP